MNPGTKANFADCIPDSTAEEQTICSYLGKVLKEHDDNKTRTIMVESLIKCNLGLLGAKTRRHLLNNAIKNKWTSIVNICLDNGFDLNSDIEFEILSHDSPATKIVKETFSTHPIMLAIELGMYEEVEKMLALGANIEVK